MPGTRAGRYAMVYVTAPDADVARSIARIVLDARLAACANLAPIDSLYLWKGALEESRETLIVFKTRAALLPELFRRVRASHPYEVPCIVSYPMGPGWPGYLEWIDAETSPQR